MNRLLSVPQVAEAFGVSTKTVYREINRGKLTKLKVRGSTRVSANEVEAYIESSMKGVSA